MKSIHIISKYFYPVAAGIETNIVETYAVLVKQGWNVIIHTSMDTLTEKNTLKEKYDKYRGINVVRYPFKWYGYIPRFKTENGDLVAMHNFNVVPHLYILLHSLFLQMIGKKNYALVLTPHGGFNPEWRIFSSFVARIKQIYHFTIGTVLINATVDAMRAVSAWERNEIVSKGVKPSIVYTITNGVENEAFLDIEKLASDEVKAKVASYGKYIIQVGRIYMIKNYETTIRALALLPKDINYVIAGPVEGTSDYQQKLKVLIKELNLTDRVFFVGVIRGIDKYYLIKNAQMMVHMALWESFCNVVHEGLSQGLICIVANNTALPLLVKDGVNGYCVETMDYKTVAKKIDYVLENKNSKEIHEMSDRNKAFGREMSWEKVALKMHELYTKLSNNY